MRSDVCFLITAFDQIREVRYTVKMLREDWSETRLSPIVIVISGDENREMFFPSDPLTRVVHLDDMVGDKFLTKVSISIMRQLEHGMIEVRDLEREFGQIDSIVHLHGDILLLGEQGFWAEFDKWKKSGLPIAADPVAGPGDVINKMIFDREYTWRFYGCELMPQLFAVSHQFCKDSGYMYQMNVRPDCDFEIKATETALIANLYRVAGLGPNILPDVNNDISPYQDVFNDYVYVVQEKRQQWGTHNTWGGWTHYGNQLWKPKEYRERMNEEVLRQRGLEF